MTFTSCMRKRVVAIISVRVDTWVKLIPNTSVGDMVQAVREKVVMLTSSRTSMLRRSIQFLRHCLANFDSRTSCGLRVVDVSIVT